MPVCLIFFIQFFHAVYIKNRHAYGSVANFTRQPRHMAVVSLRILAFCGGVSKRILNHNAVHHALCREQGLKERRTRKSRSNAVYHDNTTTSIHDTPAHNISPPQSTHSRRYQPHSGSIIPAPAPAPTPALVPAPALAFPPTSSSIDAHTRHVDLLRYLHCVRAMLPPHIIIRFRAGRLGIRSDETGRAPRCANLPRYGSVRPSLHTGVLVQDND